MRNQILLTDAVEGMQALPDACIPMTLTSPPYDAIRPYGGHPWTFKKFQEIASELWRVTMPGGVVVWVVADQIRNGSESGTSARQKLYFKKLGFRIHQTLVIDKAGSRWPSRVRYGDSIEYAYVFSKGKPRSINLLRDKPNKTAGRKRTEPRHREQRRYLGIAHVPTSDYGVRGAVWTIGVGGNSTTRDRYAFVHPALMAESVARDLILSWSAPGDLVLDPMCGSGTTCKMALLHRRKYLGFEVHKPYYRIARRRAWDARNALLDQMSESLASPIRPAGPPSATRSTVGTSGKC